MSINVGDLKRIIAESGLSDDDPVFLGNGLTRCVRAFVGHFVNAPGMSSLCNSTEEQSKTLERELARTRCGEPRAVDGLLLWDADTTEMWDEDYERDEDDDD